MTNYTLGDNDNAFEYVNRPEVRPNDTIEVVTSNQQGYRKYKVILDEDGNKDLRTIADWSNDLYEPEEDDFGDHTDDEQYGGRRRRRSSKRKSRRGKRSRTRRRRRYTRKYRRR